MDIVPGEKNMHDTICPQQKKRKEKKDSIRKILKKE